ncbi:MAG: hypothetical protein NVS9B1_17950 [Candidatus Dormibacteraceae bacterium]
MPLLLRVNGPEQVVRGEKRRESGQSLVEFSISAIFLLLLLTGLIDLGRVFFFDVSMHGAAREGARHAAWFDPGTNSNPFLDDKDVLIAVNQTLSGSGFVGQFPNGSTTDTSCPTPSDGNPYANPPFAAGYYPPISKADIPYVYVCYKKAGGGYTGDRTSPPGDNSYVLGDVQVILVMSYGLVTGFAQAAFGNGFQVAAYTHITVQGSPP